MRKLYWLARRLLGRKHAKADLRRELDASYETLVSDLQQNGVSHAEARSAARRQLGNLDVVREDVQDVWAGASLERFVRDVRYALRGLRRDRGFTASSVLTFGLAIGGTTAVATLVSSLILRPLPFADANGLVMLMERGVASTGAGHVASQPNIADWGARNRVLEGLAYFEFQTFNVGGGVNGRPEQAGGLRASHELFDVLEARPLLGRTFISSDDERRNGDVVILSYAMWADRFGADSALVGKSVQINKTPFTVIGVMRQEFRFPGVGQKLWIPMALTADDRSRGSQSFLAVGRLRNGITLDVARTDLRRVGDELAREYRDTNDGQTINAFPISDLWMQDIVRVLRLLGAAAALVLVMSIVNVAGLLLARGSARHREFGARLALGGSRAQLIGQLMTESMVVAFLGGVVGVAIAYVVLPVLTALPGLALDNLPFRARSDVVIDLRILGVSTLISIGAGLLAGVISAFSVVPRNPASLLGQGGSRGATSRTRHSVRGVLLALEVGLAVVVLVGAVLLVDSMRGATAIDPGVRGKNVHLFAISLPQKDTYGPPERPLFCGELQDRAGNTPSIEAISAVSHVPFTGQSAGRGFTIEGKAPPSPNEQPTASYGVVCPNYFRALSIPIRAGEDFSSRDVTGSPLVAIVNEAFQRRYFGSERALGKRIRLGDVESTEPWIEIIAVVGDVRHNGLISEAVPYLYRPYTQAVWPRMSVVAHTTNATRETLRAVQESVRAIAPDEPIGDPVSMETVIGSSLGYIEFPLYMMVAFASIAVLLTIVGVFGVASQIVVQRTRELGIRRALGATRSNLYQLVVSQTLTPAGLGMLIGIIVARLSGSVLNGLLYGVTATDVSTFVFAGALLGVLTVIACLAPARRAASVDPANTLRND